MSIETERFEFSEGHKPVSAFYLDRIATYLSANQVSARFVKGEICGKLYEGIKFGAGPGEFGLFCAEGKLFEISKDGVTGVNAHQVLKNPGLYSEVMKPMSRLAEVAHEQSRTMASLFAEDPRLAALLGEVNQTQSA